MKRFCSLLLVLCLLLCLLTPSLAFAKKKAKDDPIPARYQPILDDWNATTAEELRLNIVEHWKNIETVPANVSHWTPKLNPLSIRFGGTTKELIADKKNWQLAIVSSKDVDVHELIDHKLVELGGHYPYTSDALYQWLLPDKLTRLINNDPMQTSSVYVYDYDAEADDATLLICQPIPQRDNPPCARPFAEEIIWKRSANTARALQGIRLIPKEAGWKEKDFLSHSEEWDVGILVLKKDQIPSRLDEAGLLYDFAQINYFASRTSVKPSTIARELSNGIFNAAGQMIAIPCLSVSIYADDPDIEGVLIVNAKSPCLERALSYAEHFMKSNEWFWARCTSNGSIPAISRDDVDW